MAIVSGTDQTGTASAGDNGHTRDGTDASFMADVIEASNTQPVLVDFWAPWCGPCKTLGPIIERAVEAEDGKVKLVKVNIDENPGVAGQLGVRSIPAVFAFDKGQPVDGFMGALPESQIKGFIEKLLTGTDSGKELSRAMEEAEQLFQAGDIGGAAELYASVVQAQPENVKAIAGMARCYLANGDVVRAQSTLDMVAEDRRSDPDVKGVITAIDLLAEAPAAEETAEVAATLEANPQDHDARFALAESHAAAGRNQAAADELFAILEADINWQGGKAKDKLLQIFEAAGPKDEVTVNGRHKLSSLMFR